MKRKRYTYKSDLKRKLVDISSDAEFTQYIRLIVVYDMGVFNKREP